MFPKTYNINIKTPVIVVNCLPLLIDLKIPCPSIDDHEKQEFENINLNVGET